MNYIDILIIVVIAFFVYLGYTKGFIRTIMGLFGYFISIFLAYKLYPVLAKLLVEKWKIDEKIDDSFGAIVPSLIDKFINVQEGMVTEDILYKATENIAIPDVIMDRIIGIIAFVILFILLKIALGILGMILDKFLKLPILKQFNKLGGIIVGAIEGCIVVLVLLLVSNVIPNESLQKNVASSEIASRFNSVAVDAVVEVSKRV